MTREKDEHTSSPAVDQKPENPKARLCQDLCLKAKSKRSTQDSPVSDQSPDSFCCRSQGKHTENWRLPCLFCTILDNTTDIISVKDCSSRYLLMNRAGARFFDKLPREIVGKDPTFLYPADVAAKIMAGDREIVATGRTETFENTLPDGAGNLTTLLSTKGPIFDAVG